MSAISATKVVVHISLFRSEFTCTVEGIHNCQRELFIHRFSAMAIYVIIIDYVNDRKGSGVFHHVVCFGFEPLPPTKIENQKTSEN